MGLTLCTGIRGRYVKEKAIEKKTGKVRVVVNPKYFRPIEVELLIGEAKKAKQKLGWQPRTTFRELVKRMVKSDLE